MSHKGNLVANSCHLLIPALIYPSHLQNDTQETILQVLKKKKVDVSITAVSGRADALVSGELVGRPGGKFSQQVPFFQRQPLVHFYRITPKTHVFHAISAPSGRGSTIELTGSEQGCKLNPP